MVVSCKHCGKRYRVKTDKLTGNRAVFKCRVCNHSITVTKSHFSNNLPSTRFVKETPDSKSIASQSADKLVSQEKTEKSNPHSYIERKPKFGLRKKMIIFFIFIPVTMMVAVSGYYMFQMRSLSDLITDKSSKIVTEMAESVIVDKARIVAKDVQLYLETHPNLKKENFFRDPVFKEVAIKKVGKTGYTVLVERPNRDQPLHKMWLHPIEKLIGVDIDKTMKKTLGDDFQRWYGIASEAFEGEGKEASGYYMWYDNREKYMAMVPVKGTDFFIASTTYLDEFTSPVKTLLLQADKITETTFHASTIFLILAALFIAVISLFYATIISRNISYLTIIADKISVGDLNVEIHLKSHDELSILAEAISRMQTSFRISIERLRRRSDV